MIKARVEIALCSSYTSTIDAVPNYMEYSEKLSTIATRDNSATEFGEWTAAGNLS